MLGRACYRLLLVATLLLRHRFGGRICVFIRLFVNIMFVLYTTQLTDKILAEVHKLAREINSAKNKPFLSCYFFNKKSLNRQFLGFNFIQENYCNYQLWLLLCTKNITFNLIKKSLIQVQWKGVKKLLYCLSSTLNIYFKTKLLENNWKKKNSPSWNTFSSMKSRNLL